MSGSRDSGKMRSAKDEHLDQEMSAELREIESRLQTLSPRDGRLNRDQLMYLAGRASAEATEPNTIRLAWPTSLAAVSALAATIFVMLLTKPAAIPPETKTFVELRQKHEAKDSRNQNWHRITTATLYREKELGQLLSNENLLARNDDQPHAKLVEEPLPETTLTPGSWDELFNDPTFMN